VPDRKFTVFSTRSFHRPITSRFSTRLIPLTACAFTIAAVVAPAIQPSGASAAPLRPAHALAVSGQQSALSPFAVTTVRRETRAYSARELAWGMLRWFSWRPRFQMRYLRPLWERESSWNVYAYNPYSGACGIPQAVPCGKMATAGRHYRTSAWTQIRWGLRYIRGRYGSPKRAWEHENAYGWY
jgi:hypothetical protein